MRVGNFAKLCNDKISGSSLLPSNYLSTENMIPEFGGFALSNNVPNIMVTKYLKADILLSNIRPYFKKMVYAKQDGGCSNDVLCIRTDSSICLAKYLYYALSTETFFAKYVASCKGTKMPRGDKNVLLDYEINLPSIGDQQHIVDTIGSVDNLIENFEERISFLQKISSYLYLQLIEHSRKTSYLGNFIKIETGSMNLDENDPNGRYPFYTRNIGTFYSNKYTNEGKGAVVAGEGNFTPKFVNGKFGLHQRAYFIQPSTTKIGPEVIYEIILSNKKYLESVAVGSTVKSLRRFCFEQMPFFIDADYFCLNQKLEMLFGEIENLKKRKNVLLNQKRILLNKYF